MKENPQKHPELPQGILSRCLVEGDGAALARARQLRQRALVASLVLEAVLVAALVLLPLVTSNARPSPLRMTLVPPSYGSLHVNPKASSGAHGSQHATTKKLTIIYLPPQIPNDVGKSRTEVSQEPNAPEGDGPGPGDPRGPLPPASNVDLDRLTNRSTTPIRPPAEDKKRIFQPSIVQEALLVQRVQPEYPILAVQGRIEGRVQLHAIIGRDGTVNSLEIISGQLILARAAREAVSQWRYRPTLLNGQPVEVETYITVIFKLQR